jgi:hypothetical protein
LSVPVPPSGSAVEASGSLRFLGNPGGHCPCSPTPVGPAAFCGSRCNATDAAPAYVHNEGSGRLEFSGLDHTTFDLAVYASQDRLPGPAQDSLLAAGPALPGGIGYPQGSSERFRSSRLFLPSQAFPDARTFFVSDAAWGWSTGTFFVSDAAWGWSTGTFFVSDAAWVIWEGKWPSRPVDRSGARTELGGQLSDALSTPLAPELGASPFQKYWTHVGISLRGGFAMVLALISAGGAWMGLVHC